MKLLKSLAVLSAALMLTVSAGCAGGQAAPQSAPSDKSSTVQSQSTAISFTDMAGREITLTEPANRVVVLTASDCEILYAIGAGDNVVGRGAYCDYPAEALQVEAVQSGMETNTEQIIALNPQVLVIGMMDQTKEQVEQLEAAGVKVVVSDSQNIGDVYTAITMLGTLMGRETEAEKVIADMKSTFAEIAGTGGNGEKSVYFEVSPLEYGLVTAGAGTFMNEIADMMGLKNCFGDVADWARISPEQIMERNPDYIVTITMYYGEGPTPAEEIMSRAGWDKITAVQNKAILNLRDNELARPGPRLAEGAKMLADFLKTAG